MTKPELIIPRGDISTRENIKNLVSKLKITVFKSWPLDQPKTYGNSSPEEIIIDVIDDNPAKNAQQQLWDFVKHHSEYLPTVVDQLIKSGTSYQGQQLVSVRDENSDRWPDNQLSMQMVTDTILGIGSDALPFLENRNEKYAKIVTRTLHQKIFTENIKNTLKKIKSRFTF